MPWWGWVILAGVVLDLTVGLCVVAVVLRAIRVTGGTRRIVPGHRRVTDDTVGSAGHRVG